MEIPSYIPWKRALHIDFNISSVYKRTKGQNTPSFPLLMELASKTVVASSELMNIIHSCVPRNIVWDLMKAAVQSRGTAMGKEVAILLPLWQSSVFSLRQLCPDQYRLLATPYFYHSTTGDRSSYRHALQDSVQSTNNLVAAFIHIVKEHVDTQLRCLDLQGFPTGDSCIRQIAAEVIRLHEIQRERKDSREPKCTVTVFVDCSLQTNATIRVLSQALALPQPIQKLCLVIKRLEMRRLDSPIMQVMDNISDMPVCGLCNECTALPHDKLLQFFQDIGLLKMLVALDLTLCFIEFTSNPVLCMRFGDALSLLPLLRRLHLNSNSLSGCVALVFQRCYQPLEYLSLVSCQLALPDIEFLTFAPFMPTLLEINLSVNRIVADHVETFAAVLSSASSLRLFNAVCCEFEDYHLSTVVSVLVQLKQLQFIGFSNQALTASALRRNWLPLAQLKNLESVFC